MECVAYLRVSTEKQAEEGNGLDSQKRDIEIYARKNEMLITDWYVDNGYTGANMSRPQLKRLIGDVMARRISCVIAFKLDRLSRSMVDGIYIIEKIFQPNNVKFVCVHDNVNYDDPMQQAYTQMMAVFAQLDKNTMLLRMRGGMLERVKKGYWYGGGNTPYCYKYDKELGYLVKIPERAKQANDALDLYLQGWSDKRIQAVLGFKTEVVVRNILTGVVNIGLIYYKGEVYQGLHEPVFDTEKFYLGLEMRKSRSSNRVKQDTHLLTGLCYCGVCGCKIRYQKWGRRNDAKHKLYCYSRTSEHTYLPNYNKECTNGLMDADVIEKEVESKILEISLNLNNVKRIEKETKVQILEKQLERQQAKLKRLYALYSEGNDMVLDMIREEENAKKDLISKIDSEKRAETKTNTKQDVYKNIKKIADVWDDIDKNNKNIILKSIIKKIVIVNYDVDIILKDF